MKIVQLNAENVKRLKAVEIVPKGSTVIVSGKNGQGKTSVLDSILLALAGKDAQKLMTKPIREGEDHAEVRLDLGEYVVTRSWTGNDKSYLKVEGKAGEKFPSPQALLDSLNGELSFDPLEFARKNAKEQRETLLGIVDIGLDLDAWQREFDGLYEARTEVGRDVKSLEGRLDGFPYVIDCPDEEVNVAELAQKIRQADDHNRKIDQLASDVAVHEKGVERQREKVASLRAELAAEEKALQENAAFLVKIQGERDAAKKIDTTDMQTQLG